MNNLNVDIENRKECLESKKNVFKIRGKFPYSKAKTGSIFPDKFL